MAGSGTEWSLIAESCHNKLCNIFFFSVSGQVRLMIYLLSIRFFEPRVSFRGPSDLAALRGMINEAWLKESKELTRILAVVWLDPTNKRRHLASLNVNLGIHLGKKCKKINIYIYIQS